jgi:hypothetical protein
MRCRAQAGTLPVLSGSAQNTPDQTNPNLLCFQYRASRDASPNPPRLPARRKTRPTKRTQISFVSNTAPIATPHGPTMSPSSSRHTPVPTWIHRRVRSTTKAGHKPAASILGASPTAVFIPPCDSPLDRRGEITEDRSFYSPQFQSFGLADRQVASEAGVAWNRKRNRSPAIILSFDHSSSPIPSPFPLRSVLSNRPGASFT